MIGGSFGHKGQGGNIVAMLMAAVAMTGVVGVVGMQTVMGPITTASKVTHHNMADTDLMTNARVVVMNAATLTDGGDSDADGYVEPAPYLPTGAAGCSITLPGEGGCLPADIGASLTDPWGTPYAYCVWDHGDPNTSANRIKGEDSTSGAVIALISAGPDITFQTPCKAYDGDPATNDTVVDPDGVGDDKVRIYTYDGAVAGAGGLWSLKKHTPDTAVISKKLEVGDVTDGTGFTFDTTTGIGEFPSVKTDYLASMSGGSTPITMASNIALDGMWLSGDGGDEGIQIQSDGAVAISNGHLITANPNGALVFNSGPDGLHPDTGFWFRANDTPGEHLPPYTDLMRITADGNVGIGTTDPASNLYVHSAASSVVSISTAGDGTNEQAVLNLITKSDGNSNIGMAGNMGWHIFARGDAWTSYPGGPNDLGFFFYDETGSGETHILIENDTGNVGIGTTAPENRLHVSGDAQIDGSIWLDMDGNGDFGFITEAGLDGIGLAADIGSLSNPHLYVATSGSVGIGTTDPQRQLHVAGNIRVDGRNLYLGADQSLRGDGSSALYWYGGHSTVSQMLFMDAEGTAYGRLYGNGDGQNFGLMDGDAHWSILHSKDTYTDFRIDNTSEMTLYPTYLNMRSNRVANLANPVAADDAATKAYVDSMGGLSCSTGQIVKWNGTAWACANDSEGTDSDNLGAGGTTAGNITINNASPTVYFRDTNHVSGMIHMNSDLMYFLTGSGVDSGSWQQNGSTWPLTINMNNDAINVGGTLSLAEGNLNLGSEAITSSAGTIRDANGGWVRTYNNTGWYNGTHGGGWYMTDSSYLRNYGAKGVYVNTNGLPALWGVSGSSYGVHGTSDSTYGVYGYTTGATYGIRGGTASASHGGVIGYSANTNIYGILGHANAYSLYGNGQIYVSSHIRTGGQVRTDTICNAGGGGCKSQADLLTAESDPQVESVTDGKWCRGISSGRVRCDQDVPSGADNLGNHQATQNIQTRGNYISGDGGSEGLYINNAGNVTVSSNKAFFTWEDTLENRRWISVVDGQNLRINFMTTDIFETTAQFRFLENGNFDISKGGLQQSSDRRLKTQIVKISHPFEILDEINGVHFLWKEDKEASFGVIAQDVEKTMPEAVHTNTDTGWKSVEYNQMIAPLIEAVKKLKEKNDNLEARLSRVERRTPVDQ